MTTHTPNDCALLITAPLTKVDFFSDLRNSRKDFAKQWVKTQRLANDQDIVDEDLWEIYSAKVANFVLRITEEIKSLGVKVIINAKFDHFIEALLEKKAVTLDAHWFSPKLELSDFYDFSIFTKRLVESDKIVAKVLRKLLFPTMGDSAPLLVTSEDDKIEMIKKINRIFSSYNFKGNQPKPIVFKSDGQNSEEEIWIHLNRYAFEKSFPNEVKQKCEIEMFDGLYDLNHFQNNVPLDFSGVIDLTVCNSELAGKALKQFRNCLVITNRFPTDLRIRLILYKGVIKMLSDGSSQSYVDSTFKLRKQLLDQLGEE